MIHRVIENSVPEYIAGCFLNMIFSSACWRIDRESTRAFQFDEYVSNPHVTFEKPQPTIKLFVHGVVANEELFGYCKSMFHLICNNNGIVHKKIERILINANYQNLDYLKAHTDHYDEKFNSIVVMMTPFMSQTGLVVENEYIPYKFCRAVWFDSTDVHSATPLLEENPLPRITLNYMFEV